jgi:hypothetical protein
VSAAWIGYHRKKIHGSLQWRKKHYVYMVSTEAFKTDTEIAFFGKKSKVQVIGKTQLQYKVSLGEHSHLLTSQFGTS